MDVNLYLAWLCGKFPSHNSQRGDIRLCLGLAMLAKAIYAPFGSSSSVNKTSSCRSADPNMEYEPMIGYDTFSCPSADTNTECEPMIVQSVHSVINVSTVVHNSLSSEITKLRQLKKVGGALLRVHTHNSSKMELEHSRILRSLSWFPCATCVLVATTCVLCYFFVVCCMNGHYADS